ncbi:hypothetical protein AKJ29_00520 [Aliiroseovarius crassostreae]|uniref:Uncharacterized protein n=1 Tax=Aliiroseovarius crassostreae TaxID=154981 RepID=A0A0P7IUP0_9RHOB|nr:hypothetical protein [Aliiroseovarius crassostreae]KPN62694.1 hypothetical protein AKJ29_00520 [Aliiroseovarius crassostreae]
MPLLSKIRKQTNKKKTRAKDEDEMKPKDIMGVRDTLKDKRKANAATKDDVARASDAAGRKAEARVKQEMDKTAEATAKRTADQVRQEFERMSGGQYAQERGQSGLVPVQFRTRSSHVKRLSVRKSRGFCIRGLSAVGVGCKNR